VVLKNSFHLALLLASTQRAFFRYPRFALFDAIEDKEMTVDRSQNFQRLIVERSAGPEIGHQIIFTTSMVDPQLNTSPSLTIGRYYTPGNKALELDISAKK
jgi:hypothetical protein